MASSLTIMWALFSQSSIETCRRCMRVTVEMAVVGNGIQEWTKICHGSYKNRDCVYTLYVKTSSMRISIFSGPLHRRAGVPPHLLFSLSPILLRLKQSSYGGSISPSY
ncbi:hypothetical protein QN277_025738 [Acacia crassicarpa]|uniref:Uncharacterized protein n=1 Tax=Acacia crassicarpa TaxID=499986 RepID=A0AAE1MGV9_9FABA|nr:hypothetical protein QN277_025738 [Acacia crassicarpa]